MDRDTARELRELRAMVELVGARNEALWGLVISLTRHDPRLAEVLKVWRGQDRVPDWMYQPTIDRWRELVEHEAETLADACDKPL